MAIDKIKNMPHAQNNSEQSFWNVEITIYIVKLTNEKGHSFKRCFKLN